MTSARSTLLTTGLFLLLASVLPNSLGTAQLKSRPRGNERSKVQTKTAFTQSCNNPSYPTPPPSKPLGIDSVCGAQGSGTGAEGTQNAAKNNFCASGTPQEITIDYLKNLQAQVEKDSSINFGDKDTLGRKRGPTTDRSALRKLGEGTLVTLKAYVLIARQEGAESVNCGTDVHNQAAYHDIHISLAASDTVTEECLGVVGEMSPHHRPDAWNSENVSNVAKAKLPVRVTGHLFFDSSHLPCSGGSEVRSNPRRVSLWEIHPIYKFEVGSEGSNTWLSLDQWAAKAK